MKTKILIVLLFLNKFLVGQCFDYWHLDISGQTLYQAPGTFGAMHWWNYINLQTAENFSSGVPSYLSNVQDRFNEATNIWETSLRMQNQEYVNFNHTTSGVLIYFTNQSEYFDNPYTNTGVTQPCVAAEHYVYSCTESEAQIKDFYLSGSPLVTRARVNMNATTQFGEQFSSDPCNTTPVFKVSLTYAFMHELGHVLGLPDCDFDKYSIMHLPLEYGPNNCYIDDADKLWMRNLIGSNPAALSKKVPRSGEVNSIIESIPQDSKINEVEK